GIIIEGTTVPYSEILIKNKGIEYKGQADDKGIFKIPLKEVTKEDALRSWSLLRTMEVFLIVNLNQ
uniref:hypothetical protein n=1 Tax=Enterococcus faecium TaxID=1352 RepID=UPI0034E98780